MLPEIGASELLVIAVVALIVVGPKDLPKLLRKLGQFMAKLRGMAAEFRASFDEMARQSELDELRAEVEAMRRGQFSDVAAQAGQVEMTQTFDDIHQSLSDVGGQLHPPMSYQYAEPEALPAPKPRRAAKATSQKVAVKPKAAAKPRTAAKTAAAKPAPKRVRRPTVEPG
ncbi:MAG: Sec-independent protein translocase protein TatB [Phenylobacterium sp.]